MRAFLILFFLCVCFIHTVFSQTLVEEVELEFEFPIVKNRDGCIVYDSNYVNIFAKLPHTPNYFCVKIEKGFMYNWEKSAELYKSLGEINNGNIGAKIKSLCKKRIPTIFIQNDNDSLYQIFPHVVAMMDHYDFTPPSKEYIDYNLYGTNEPRILLWENCPIDVVLLNDHFRLIAILNSCSKKSSPILLKSKWTKNIIWPFEIKVVK